MYSVSKVPMNNDREPYTRSVLCFVRFYTFGRTSNYNYSETASSSFVLCIMFRYK